MADDCNPSMPVNRRRFLAATALAATAIVPASNRSRASGAEAVEGLPGRSETPLPKLIVRTSEPRNLEFPFPALREPIVPNNLFYVRNHFAMPKLDASTWRLKVEGHVRNEFEVSYNELRRLPSRTVTATLECAGNGRSFLVPKAKGVQWEFGGVGTAEWTGVPLSTVLDKAGIREGTVDVVLEGADEGEIADEPKPTGLINFARSLPIAKARRAEVLLVHKMNGEDLPAEHGYPVRVVVPGWYGMASVKWLTRISVSAAAFQGFWQTTQYSYWSKRFGQPTQVPITELSVKSEIARPSLHEVVPPNVAYQVFGAAWAGEADVAKVDVSTDGGRTWQPARLLGRAVPFTWRLWEYEWRTPNKPGKCVLMAKATDFRGRTQPMTRNRDYRAYMIHQVLPVEVEVR